MVNQRIAIVGAGANGAAFGADMVRAGLDVTLLTSGLIMLKQ